MRSDEYYMQRCLALAEKGLPDVAPNPMVGCVIVHNDEIIGEGYHMKYGDAHAEVNAIHAVQNQALLPYSTLYVSLEPCSHYGKTPPCANLIIHHKIKRVVIGCHDPNPLVSGKGIQLLKDAGVEVITGIWEQACSNLNKRFIKYHRYKSPYVILKWAESADGFIAPLPARQEWLSGPEAKVLTHQWRTEEQAILIGRKTAEIDNPQLTARLCKGKNPLRLVIDPHNKLSRHLNIFNQNTNTIVFNAECDKLVEQTKYLKLDFSASVSSQILHHLYTMQIISVMIEGGAETINHFIEENNWNEARVIKTNKTLGNGIPAPNLHTKADSQTQIGADTLEFFINRESWVS
ncbi:MAG: bifunctional diaminohydroxyphosphoribosylaminopyrimidine deaminase/5-amino-6-(5-phosphoribosylamino)uracil reductase RibD [Bacteroidetes bacterium]|nr:bifunctional diaminohydroxyphosphoribosylaminopyrimidine deaminase/5-amino-6-(5-phosphoribosylamino)uracil reductase RibD [Bacteroidota bacterium]